MSLSEERYDNKFEIFDVFIDAFSPTLRTILVVIMLHLSVGLQL